MNILNIVTDGNSGVWIQTKNGWAMFSSRKIAKDISKGGGKANPVDMPNPNDIWWKPEVQND